MAAKKAGFNMRMWRGMRLYPLILGVVLGCALVGVEAWFAYRGRQAAAQYMLEELPLRQP